MGNEYYNDAYAFQFEDDYNGNLTADDLAEYSAQWHDLVGRIRPLTKEIYDAMTDGQKNRYGRPVWSGAGGLKVVSGGKVRDLFTEIRDKASERAKRIAEIDRADAGWTGNKHLIAPDGSTKSANGQPYGYYARPGDEHALGMWDGVLTDRTRFTA